MAKIPVVRCKVSLQLHHLQSDYEFKFQTNAFISLNSLHESYFMRLCKAHTEKKLLKIKISLPSFCMECESNVKILVTQFKKLRCYTTTQLYG